MENSIDVAVKAIIQHQGEILIIKRTNYKNFGAGTWEFPGGGLHFGENLTETLKREALEEVGIDITIKQLLYATTFNTSDQRQVVVLTYLCDSHTKDVSLSSEHDDFKWVGINGLKTYLGNNILYDLYIHHVFDVLQLEAEK